MLHTKYKSSGPHVQDKKFLLQSRAVTLLQIYEKKAHFNSNLDLVNINVYIKFGEILSICPQDMVQKEILTSIKDHTSVPNGRKMM